jgi:glycerol-3-phosphate cytidylyltransferase-like family protein
MNAIAAFAPRATVVAGDEDTGSWRVLLNHAPDIVMLGYDQDAIANELEKRSVPYLYLSPHEPERFKSSILQDER